MGGILKPGTLMTQFQFVFAQSVARQPGLEIRSSRISQRMELRLFLVQFEHTPLIAV